MGDRLAGKVAVVTGAASGIGLACAERLAGEGARVYLTDIQSGAGHAAAERICAGGGVAHFLEHDVTQEKAWIEVIASVCGRERRLDILVNNAGICLRRDVLNQELDEFRRVFAVNVEGVFLGLKYAIPLMQMGDGGSIINMSSVSGLKGIPGMSAYSSSKGAVRLITKAVALEHAADGIRVNSVHPGMIDTPIMDDLVGAHEAERSTSVRAWATDLVPTGKPGEARQVADTVLWLSSDEASYVNGAEIVVDGGMALR